MNPFSNRRSARRAAIRSAVSLTGDVAAGVAIASACVWIIQTASLGLFLSFLIWLIGLVISLALSQYVVHPTIRLVLSDDKLDRGIAAVSSLGRAASTLMGRAATPEGLQTLRSLWPDLSRNLRRRFG